MNEAIVAVQPKPLVMVLDEAVKKEEKAKNINSGGCCSGGHDWTCWPLCIRHNNDGDNDDCCECDDACCDACCDALLKDCDCGGGGGGGADCDCNCDCGGGDCTIL